jgi:hypothetical protein
LTIRALAQLDRARSYVGIIGAAAGVLPEDTKLRRLLSSIDPTLFAVTCVVEELYEIQNASATTYTLALVLSAVRKFGTLACRLDPGGRRGRWAELWIFGEHLISITMTHGAQFKSRSEIADLIRTAVEFTTADLGTQRLRLGPEGLVADDVFGEIVTPETAALIEDIRAELATGETCRTILLYGPPGSGKSSAARQIAAAFGDTTLTVESGAWTGNRPEGNENPLTTIAVQCGADSIVFDDYDRREDEASSLSLIADLRRTAKVVIFTANSRSGFSAAETRPQRFDKIAEIASLVRATAKSIAPDLPASVAEEAWTKLLASYLRELAVLCRAGRVDPRVALDGLLARQGAAEDAS